MARKSKQQEGPSGAPEWMTTYSDLVTLLLCFFVMLYASSDVDVAKVAAISQSFGSSVSARPSISSISGMGINQMLGAGITQMPIVNNSAEEANEQFRKAQQELRDMASEFKTYFADNELSEVIDIEVAATYITLNFKDGILFDKGRAELKPTAIEALSFVADEIVRSPGTEIKIEGHTDSDPINTVRFKDNMDLSQARAANVFRYFKDEKLIDPTRMGAEGYGEYRPIAENDIEENKTKNRRVEIKIMSSALSGN